MLIVRKTELKVEANGFLP
ncbi:Protein of unknown function [Bacillus wiedmannii]|uniref:Uncharacterized protein n=1 Tax=Bacillus wiedmannii TaxID=1890302 RepID=A0AB37Z264_9BACI|nr:Protein of unknown function [Bacillus wiedmannii]